MTARQLEKLLLADGWYYFESRGSHKQFKHREKEGKITIPQHKGDIKIKTANTILKQAGLK
ncbi:MAG: type II toxin-antitoxin system HicA family toxin [Ruminiclostridium sp.]|jgi:predicted RNA binding protein YcfA (HicA-like mRNA interferase family)|nr:type II toxin-antitoxin system HicA family toxin [Ruminiclostridium sp.]